jgi:hypothetical protein
MASFTTQLGGLDDLVGPNAPGADAESANAPIHDGADPLEVRFEPAGSHVVGMAKRAAIHRYFATNFAVLGHPPSIAKRRKSSGDGPVVVPIEDAALGADRTERPSAVV